jgi:hypothetical protein
MWETAKFGMVVGIFPARARRRQIGGRGFSLVVLLCAVAGSEYVKRGDEFAE